MKLANLLSAQPPVRSIRAAREEIRRELVSSNRRLVVIDDDPTGTQTVHDVKVYMNWSVDQLRKAFASRNPVFYISTNSRSLNRGEAEALGCEVGHNLAEAARRERADVILASRSDSTLRGHFPYEVTALTSGLGQQIDGILIVPAFFEAGRYTIDDIHWVDGPDGLVPAHETEFAKDPVFGYNHGNLREWVEEKTGGAIKANTVRSISLEMIRKRGPEAVAEELMQASGGQPIVVNAACYEDLEVAVMGLLSAESAGKRFAYRCAACLVKVRGGFEDKPLLNRDDILPGDGPGLVVAGSYVGKTTRQLERLMKSGLAVGIELRVETLLEDGERDGEIHRASEWIDGQLSEGRSVAVYTSRATLSNDRQRFLETGGIIMSSLCRVVSNLKVQPGFLIAKGGITSIEIARSALGVGEADVMGQVLEGIPVWRLGEESRWSGIPYIVFPGNVGDDDALLRTFTILQDALEIGGS